MPEITHRSPRDMAAIRDYITRIGLDVNAVARDAFDATPLERGGADVEWETHTRPDETPPAMQPGTWEIVFYEATSSPAHLPRTRWRMVTPVAPPFPIRNGRRAGPPTVPRQGGCMVTTDAHHATGRLVATHTQPFNIDERWNGVTHVTPGITVEVECDPATIPAALDALDRAVADVKAQLSAVGPMRVIESAPPAQDTPRV